MKVRLLDVAAPAWTEFLRDTPHDFYHLPAYVALSAVHEQGEARAVLVDDGPRSILLPLILRPIPGSDRRDATSPYGYPGPLARGTDDPAFLSSGLAAGMDALRSEGIVSAFVRFHPLLNPVMPEGVGEVVLHGDTVSIDLTLSPEQLWAQTRRNHRRDIISALRRGLVARMDAGFERLDMFKRLYRVTMDRLEAAKYYYFDDDYFDRLREALGGSLHLCVVERDDAVIAAGLFVETGGIVQYHLMGTDEGDARAQSSKLLVHFGRRWASERGDSCLHLGGGVGGADDSLLHFKSGFSPRRHPFGTLRAILDEAEYSRLSREHAPPPELGPDGGYFPAYRATC